MTEVLFLARQNALAEEKNKSSETPMLYTCAVCSKGYRSSKAHAQHLKSRSHTMRASQVMSHIDDSAIIKPLLPRVDNKLSQQREQDDEDSEESDEWEEVDPDEELLGEATDSVSRLGVNEQASNVDMDEDDEEYELDPSCCFMCDLEHDAIESCMVHMHKQHGFYVPDVEYLKDPNGLLTFLGLKVNYLACELHFCCSLSLFVISLFFLVELYLTYRTYIVQVKRDFMCLYCNERRHPFNSLEAVRKHMEAKSHCKVHYGDGGDDEEAELEEFYDYSSRFLFVPVWFLFVPVFVFLFF